MTKKRKPVENAERLIPGTLAPWAASGSGWANAGVSFIVRLPNGTDEKRTLYAEHFDPTILSMAVRACGRLEIDAQIALNKGAK